MNTPSNVKPESPDSQVVAPTIISPARRMYWSIRRELWESRSIYLAPLAVAAVFVFGFMISTVTLPHRMRETLALDPMRQHALLEQPYIFAAGLIMATTFVVGVFYCLDALHGERRDRSILFWKSLPVSDLTTVLSKASIPLVVLPLLTFAITLATHLLMLLLGSAALLASGQSAAAIWTRLPFLQMSLMLLYHLVMVHALWYAPIFGWLLLVSGWARRAAFLWAVLPPLAIGVVEKLAFNTSHFAAMLGNRISGGMEGRHFPAHSVPMDLLTQLTPEKFLSAPGLWIGLILAAAFLAAAVRLRRYQGPI
jgi:ABC-2 type transport system permease protein